MARRKMVMTGVKALDRVLRKLPKKIRGRVLQNAVAAGGRVIRDAAKRIVVVDTGGLRDSIAARKPRGLKRSSGVVRVGPTWPQGAHGHLVEFGTEHMRAQPWLRPAWDSEKGVALDKIGVSLGRAVERAAVKLAGSFKKSGLRARR